MAEPRRLMRWVTTMDKSMEPLDVDDVLGWLQDNDMLSDKGEEFRTKFWKEYIHEESD